MTQDQTTVEREGLPVDADPEARALELQNLGEAEETISAVDSLRQEFAIDPGHDPALLALQDVAGLVDVESFAIAYRADADWIIAQIRLLGLAVAQLRRPELVDPKLKSRQLDAARAWHEGVTPHSTF